jgi:hypothetical protein
MKKNSMKKINNWLDERIVEVSLDTFSHSHKLPLKYYYTESELKKFSDSDNKITIDNRTRRNDANNIFCELVEYCVKFKINDLDGLPLFKPLNKNSFYNFAHDNSSKTI